MDENMEENVENSMETENFIIQKNQIVKLYNFVKKEKQLFLVGFMMEKF